MKFWAAIFVELKEVIKNLLITLSNHLWLKFLRKYFKERPIADTDRVPNTAQKMISSIRYFFSKPDQIHGKLPLNVDMSTMEVCASGFDLLHWEGFQKTLDIYCIYHFRKTNLNGFLVNTSLSWHFEECINRVVKISHICKLVDISFSNHSFLHFPNIY